MKTVISSIAVAAIIICNIKQTIPIEAPINDATADEAKRA